MRRKEGNLYYFLIKWEFLKWKLKLETETGISTIGIPTNKVETETGNRALKHVSGLCFRCHLRDYERDLPRE